MSYVLATLTVAGLVQSGVGLERLKRFKRRPRGSPLSRPPITILKPLKGDEPRLEEALTSFCRQSYPKYQIVFGVQDPEDPCITLVERLRIKFPALDIALVIDSTAHKGNAKIANLINMWSYARYEFIIVADSDVHVEPSFIDSMVWALDVPRVGVVTALYAGVAAAPTVVAQFGTAQINHIFLPGLLVGQMLGREDCFGAAMALRRETLTQIGGFSALLPYLADDAALGRLAHRLTLKVVPAPAIVYTTVSESTWFALFEHELRWARTIRALTPFSYAASLLQYPLVWAFLTGLSADFSLWSVVLASIAWAIRGLQTRSVSRELNSAEFACWWLPLREVLSVSVLLTSYLGNRVIWRGSAIDIVRKYGVP
jgi:ceramide glucosyltransferase